MFSSKEEQLKAEVVQLRQRLQDAIEKYRGLEERHPSGPPSDVGFTTPPTTVAFTEDRNQRTDIRKRPFCTPNRAGNALCAWHDSWRGRREFPPRNAPPGVLNCGCTYEEALFEESLSRHHVGNYYPGEGVRMDPALRNPLLKLLKRRYGYQDGDFERDPRTGNWVEEEGSEHWRQQARQGSITRRVDTERH